MQIYSNNQAFNSIKRKAKYINYTETLSIVTVLYIKLHFVEAGLHSFCIDYVNGWITNDGIWFLGSENFFFFFF